MARRYRIKLTKTSLIIGPLEDKSFFNRPEVQAKRQLTVSSRKKFARDTFGQVRCGPHYVVPRSDLSPEEQVELCEFLHMSDMIKGDHTVVIVGSRRGYYGFLNANDALLFRLRWG